MNNKWKNATFDDNGINLNTLLQFHNILLCQFESKLLLNFNNGISMFLLLRKNATSDDLWKFELTHFQWSCH